jgi:hypothetical protein
MKLMEKIHTKIINIQYNFDYPGKPMRDKSQKKNPK